MFFFQAEDGIRDYKVTGVQTCALPISVDAALNAIDAVTGMKGRLQDYSLRAATSGKDAIGEVSMKVDFDGTLVWGKGASTDVIEASARAYLSALNRVTHPAVQHVKEIGP